ncbi:hypothetical protein Tco_1278222, partial [Tanacetum coccineum]
EIVFGNPFIEETSLAYDKEEGTIVFRKNDEKITFKMPHRMEMFGHIDLKDMNTDPIPPFVLGNKNEHGKVYYSNSLIIQSRDHYFFSKVEHNQRSTSFFLPLFSSLYSLAGKDKKDKKKQKQSKPTKKREKTRQEQRNSQRSKPDQPIQQRKEVKGQNNKVQGLKVTSIQSLEAHLKL